MTDTNGFKIRLSPLSVSGARRIAKEHGMKRLLVLGIDSDGGFAFTIYGATKADCQAMARWADERAPWIGQEMDAAK